MQVLTILLSFLIATFFLPVVAAEKTAADYYVKQLPGAPEPLLKMHAG